MPKVAVHIIKDDLNEKLDTRTQFDPETRRFIMQMEKRWVCSFETELDRVAYDTFTAHYVHQQVAFALAAVVKAGLTAAQRRKIEELVPNFKIIDR